MKVSLSLKRLSLPKYTCKYCICCTTPLSKCLQTVQLALLTVHRMVGQLVDNMQKKRADFQVFHDSGAKFVQWANDQPAQLSKVDVYLTVEESLGMTETPQMYGGRTVHR